MYIYKLLQFLKVYPPVCTLDVVCYVFVGIIKYYEVVLSAQSVHVNTAHKNI